MDKNEAWTLMSNNGQNRLSLAGEIDFAGSPGLRKRFESLLGESGGNLTLDMSGVGYLDSSGLAVLIELKRKLGAAGRSLTLAGLTPQVEKIFRLTQVAGLFGL